MSASTSKGKDGKSHGTKKLDRHVIEALKHIDSFYANLPPGLVKEDEEKPEDCIPDLPENHDARSFLAKAPSKGLWMPLGKEVKVMKCWRCKAYGHRTGDKECPLFISGNAEIEKFRYIHEDPMYNYINDSKMKEKEEKVKQLQALLESGSSTDSEADSSDSSDEASKSSSHSNKKKKNLKRKGKHKHHHKNKSKKRRHSKSKMSKQEKR